MAHVSIIVQYEGGRAAVASQGCGSHLPSTSSKLRKLHGQDFQMPEVSPGLIEDVAAHLQFAQVHTRLLYSVHCTTIFFIQSPTQTSKSHRAVPSSVLLRRFAFESIAQSCRSAQCPVPTAQCPRFRAVSPPPSSPRPRLRIKLSWSRSSRSSALI
ncbi:hypothetical protein N7539_007377 [Penicillium diatomitis]|uniref:Uncharacterized protein n=1 Tax=Penicillium diatomitis TaxID=2819901 RepID=A0A9X0BNY5_9EURO|nr:uncharacterized protein N7539_007377 [Penicillium diatomitis]KAJ5477233.1 hypothetical protein N7539_007377 [Penicillium diatomitis]